MRNCSLDHEYSGLSLTFVLKFMDAKPGHCNQDYTCISGKMELFASHD